MGICIVVCIVDLAGILALHKRPIWPKIRSPCMLLLLFGVMGCLAGVAVEQETGRLSEGRLKRNAPGEGDLETEAVCYLQQEETEYPITLTVEERMYRQEEEQALLAAAMDEIKTTFGGENPSLEAISEKPVVLDRYQEGAVLAEWFFSDEELISSEGEVFWQRLKQDRQELQALVVLSCGKSEEFYEFTFWLAAPQKSRKERLILEIEEQIAGQDPFKEWVSLPTVADGEFIVWKDAPSYLPVELMCLGVAAAFATAYGAREQRVKQLQKKKRELLLQYPDFVSKLSLLLGAGMNISGALRKMDQMYQKRRQNGGKEEAAYEALGRTMREMENGIGELRAYQGFAERCGLQPYRKLISLLIAGQKAGNRRLMEQLHEEADRVFLERKNTARKLGEEAGTKMLFPMMMMLLIVMGIVMIPAALSIYGT